jgi:hypothetical protein
MVNNKSIQPIVNELPSRFADRLGIYYSKLVNQEHKKENGQFFTPVEIAILMGSFSKSSDSSLRILDPGCGTAILTCALIEHLASNNNLRAIELVAYETDNDLIPLSILSLEYLKEWLKTKKINFHYALKTTDFVFEIQVRTLNQHAWSNTAHSLSYKQEADLPVNLKRKVYRLLSLYELADDEFSIVNKALKEHQNSPIYMLLKKLEGKFYKFAKFDYDRETSLKYINIFLSYFETEDVKTQLIDNIENFIASNEQKIQKIYDENRNRFYEILLLTQPEIFIIWYMLENNSFTIEDNWANDFDAEDLEQIKTIWGNKL